MNIATMFNIGEKVRYIYRADYVEETPCEVCNGTGTATIIPDVTNPSRRYPHKCPRCDGEGIDVKEHYEWFMGDESPVIGIKTLVEQGKVDSPSIYYLIAFTGDSRRGLHIIETPRGPAVLVPENEVFWTAVAAQGHIDKNNAEERNLDLERAR